jgi:exopolysaccharide biosynthesis WecB/TagA/CpsF family protein
MSESQPRPTYCPRGLSKRIERHQRTHVVFVNAAKVVQFRNSPELRNAMTRADLLLADGVPVVWSSRLQSSSLPGRVNGTDLMERMLGVSSVRGYRIYLLGAQADVLEPAIAAIRNRYPGIEIAGYRHRYFSHAEERDIVHQINLSHVDLLFLGISTPTKELWGDITCRRWMSPSVRASQEASTFSQGLSPELLAGCNVPGLNGSSVFVRNRSASGADI